MTASAGSPNRHRLLAVIAPGAGPHLVGAPSTTHWTTRPARSQVFATCAGFTASATPEVLERWTAERAAP